MINLDEAIAHCEEVAEEYEQKLKDNPNAICYTSEFFECAECAKEHRQLAKWLRELQRYRFEISECKAILYRPTPDVTDNDWKRAMYVLQTFPDVRGDER